LRSVILFIPTLITGGAEKLVVDLAVNMDRSAFDVCVAAVSGIAPEGAAPNEFCSVIKKNHIPVYDLKGKNKFETALNIRRLLREKRPDVVHTNLSTVLYVMFFAALYDTKVRVFTFHNVASLTASGFKKRLYEFAFKILNFTPVAICDFVKKTIAEEYRLPPAQIPCIYNGVDTKAFSPRDEARVHKPADRPVEFVSTGILYHLKNHKLLIDAFAKTEMTHPAIHLTILGDGELREELERQIAAYGLADKINILGITDHVADFLNPADIYVMSSDLEGLPISVLEAMACGLPIIATAAGGVVDIVKNGENGIVTPTGDVAALSDAMIEMIENDALRKAFGETSRKRALEYDIRHCVEKYQKLYLDGKLDDECG
jgi:glycosyltransferase involved in cell wall biosynthesis